jgi:hypothetical protein
MLMLQLTTAMAVVMVVDTSKPAIQLTITHLHKEAMTSFLGNPK